jgi:hypothetical protein
MIRWLVARAMNRHPDFGLRIHYLSGKGYRWRGVDYFICGLIL